MTKVTIPAWLTHPLADGWQKCDRGDCPAQGLEVLRFSGMPLVFCHHHARSVRGQAEAQHTILSDPAYVEARS